MPRNPRWFYFSCFWLSLALAAGCQREGSAPEAPAAPPPVSFKTVEWPALPKHYAPEGANVKIRKALKDELLGVEEFELKSKELAAKKIRVVGDELRLQWSDQKIGGEKVGYMVWSHLKVQPEGSIAMEMFGAVENAKLIGYRYDLAGVRALKRGDRLATLDPTGWRTVVVDAPVEGDFLGIEDFEANLKGKAATTLVKVRGLRLVNHQGGKVALVWAE